MAGEKDEKPAVEQPEGADTEVETKPEPVDVDLSPEEMQKAGVKPEAKPAPEKPTAEDEAAEQGDGEGRVDTAPETGRRQRNRVPARDRINQLRREATESTSLAQRLMQENEALKTRSQQSDRAAMVHYESSVSNARALAQQALVEAHTANDPVKIADATAKLSAAAAAEENIKSWKAANPEPQQRQQDQQQRQPVQQQQQRVVDPQTQAWVQDNGWFDPQSGDYDAEMAETARAYATLLETRMKRQGRARDIGKATYFADIEKHMRDEFPDSEYFSAPPERGGVPRMQQNGHVAPAVRATNQNGGSSPTRVTLSPDEREMALSLRTALPKRSKPYDDAELYRIYAVNKVKDQAVQRAKKAAGE